MHDPATRTTALALVRAGVNDCEVARRLGLPRTTVRDWRRAPYEREALVERCERCWQPMRAVRFTPDDYAELLGLYLGDGHISVLASPEILFVDTCRLLELRPRRYARHVRLYRRADVARLLEHVGRKS